jgi:hypothetical protein
MRRPRTSSRDDQGVVAIELVLILPFLLMLVVGVLVLGNFMSVKGRASNFARDGARQAALFPASTISLPNLPAGATVSIIGPACPASPRDPTRSVTVQVTLLVALDSIPLIGTVLPSAQPERVTMRCGG